MTRKEFIGGAAALAASKGLASLPGAAAKKPEEFRAVFLPWGHNMWGEALPEGLILLSPWVDVSMDNPEAADLVSVEPLLHLDLMRVHGRWWAGALDVHDPRVSPLYGDMRGLPPVTLYCGTRELLCPDIRLCRDRLEAAGVEVALHIGRGLNHDYPLMPIPEAEAAFRGISAMLEHCNSSPDGV